MLQKIVAIFVVEYKLKILQLRQYHVELIMKMLSFLLLLKLNLKLTPICFEKHQVLLHEMKFH